MSRSGRIPISIPESTEVKIENNIIFAKGKLGELSFNFKSDAKVEIKDNAILVDKSSDSIAHQKMWGTVRSRINNIINGVSNGFKKPLKPLVVVVIVRPFEEESHLEIHLKE